VLMLISLQKDLPHACFGTLIKTSGAWKPLVPARFAWMAGLGSFLIYPRARILLVFDDGDRWDTTGLTDDEDGVTLGLILD
jgi:hypothetical protein